MSEKTTHGARWVRAALQVNPYEYQGKNAPSATYSTEADYNKALLDECEAQGIELFAITDHWKVDSALQLIRDAADRGHRCLSRLRGELRRGHPHPCDLRGRNQRSDDQRRDRDVRGRARLRQRDHR